MWRLSLTALLLVACEGKNKIDWVQFNKHGDELFVHVGTEDAGPPTQRATCVEPDTTDTLALPSLCDGVSDCICLSSTLGAAEVGIATVTPAVGPVGTHHDVRVTVLDDFEDIVQRVTVVLRAEGRSSEEFLLRQDSADPGGWLVTIESLGEPDEERDDVIGVRLFEPTGDFSKGEGGE